MARTSALLSAAVLAVASVATGSATGVATASEDSHLAQSRAIAMRFGGELKGHLQKAMASNGPVAAITVCKDTAPAIAQQLSDEFNVAVNRVSLKPRNPNGAPDAWQQQVLEGFDQQNANGVPVAALERLDTASDGSARYLKAIPAQPMCLMCHGQQLAPEVSAALQEHYPNDVAVGYQAGEIRGAFSIDWPAPGE